MRFSESGAISYPCTTEGTWVLRDRMMLAKRCELTPVREYLIQAPRIHTAKNYIVEYPKVFGEKNLRGLRRWLRIRKLQMFASYETKCSLQQDPVIQVFIYTLTTLCLHNFDYILTLTTLWLQFDYILTLATLWLELFSACDPTWTGDELLQLAQEYHAARFGGNSALDVGICGFWDVQGAVHEPAQREIVLYSNSKEIGGRARSGQHECTFYGTLSV